jgi:hypothetical protein
MKPTSEQNVKKGQKHIIENITGTYQHYKGGKYEVLGIGTHSETEEKLVVYKALYAPYEIWVRPYEMFFGTTEVNGKSIPRFKKIESK